MVDIIWSHISLNDVSFLGKFNLFGENGKKRLTFRSWAKFDLFSYWVLNSGHVEQYIFKVIVNSVTLHNFQHYAYSDKWSVSFWAQCTSQSSDAVHNLFIVFYKLICFSYADPGNINTTMLSLLCQNIVFPGAPNNMDNYNWFCGV